MGADIKTENIDLGGNNVLLVSVKGGKDLIGVCSTGNNLRRGDISALNKMFYIGSEPALNIIASNNGDKRTDLVVAQCQGYAGMPHDINNTITDSFNKINRGDSLENGLRELFVMLPDGVYTVYTAEYYPTDGSGSFFWGSYNLPREVRGTAPYNRTIGKDKTYLPCFLIPGNTLDNYTPKRRNIADEAVKSRKYQGIVYHLSGLHSVLIKGHMGAVACAAAEIPFKCAVIERITDVYTVPALKKKSGDAPKSEDNSERAMEAVTEQPAEASAPAVVYEEKQEGITGFRSASVKLPLELLPNDMLRNLLETRVDAKPRQYENIVKKLDTVRHTAITNNSIPRDVHEKCELMPDCEMMESAFAISSLSEEQLAALLAGDVEYNGEVIISPNFYSSIVAACNFLRFHNEKRYIEFSIEIMENPELYATHEYIAKRLSRLNSRRVYQFFKSVLANDDPKFDKIIPTADRYVKEYEVKNS